MDNSRPTENVIGWEVVNLTNTSAKIPDSWRQQIAGLLNAAFPDPDGYPTIEQALTEVECLMESAARMLIVICEDEVVGFIGALPQYRGHVWELHPLVVRQDLRRRGMGKTLVRALEREALGAGVSTIMLGTDDVDASTSLGGRQIFPGVLAHAIGAEDLRGHPFRFYQGLGYEIVGVIPDANGPGKPDIWMAKVLAG